MPPSSTETPPPAETGFDPLAFWIQYKNHVLLFAAVFAVGFLGYSATEWSRRRTTLNAAELLAAANGDEGYRKVIARYPKTSAGASAMLLLAETLRTEGKYEESSTELRAFIAKFPAHPLLSGAWTGLATNQEAQGKTDEALATYQKALAAFPTSFTAPVALLGQARILRAQGKTEDAKRLYEQVIQNSQGTAFAQEAMSETQKLAKAQAQKPAPPPSKPDAPEPAEIAKPADSPAPNTPAPPSDPTAPAKP